MYLSSRPAASVFEQPVFSSSAGLVARGAVQRAGRRGVGGAGRRREGQTLYFQPPLGCASPRRPRHQMH